MANKPKTTMYPKTQEQAFKLMLKLAKDFEFEPIIICRDDFQDQMETETWTDADYKNAFKICVSDLCDGVGYAIDGAIIQVNKNKKLYKN
jgi:hypothetical protein